MVQRRVVTVPRPVEIASRDGLAYSLWLPDRGQAPRGGVVILHGAGSCKESHHDYARLLVAAGFAALAFDQRGHGESEGLMGADVVEDTAAMASLLRERSGTPALALRGSSMGGLLAILAGAEVGADVVVAICPASPEGLRRGLVAGTLGLGADVAALEELLSSVDLPAAVESLSAALLLLHAEGDEVVPVQHSRELAEHFRNPASRLITVPGGHHRSIQHDEEMQAVSLRFVERALARSSVSGAEQAADDLSG